MLGVFKVCAYLIATMGSGIVIVGLAVGTLKPCPTVPEPGWESQMLRERNLELAEEVRHEREAHLKTLVLLDQLRRGAVLFPVRGDETPACDRIPATSVPTAPAEVPRIPRAKE